MVRSGAGSGAGKAVKAAALAGVAAAAAFSLSFLVDKLGELDAMASPAAKPPRKPHRGSSPPPAPVPAPAPAAPSSASFSAAPTAAVPAAAAVRVPPAPAASADAAAAAAAASAAATAAETARNQRERSANLRKQWMAASDVAGFEHDVLVARYLQLRSMAPPPDADCILRDVHRTFPRSELFQRDATRACLQRLLEAYANYDPEVGYVQGMNFLAGFLMHHLQDEADVFVLLVRLMQVPKYNMRGFYTAGMPQVGVMSHVVEALMEEHVPAVAAHFQQVGCETAFFFEWWFTLFTYTLPLQLVEDVWVEFFNVGWLGVFRIVVVLLRHVEPRLRGTDLHGTVTVLKGFHAHRLALDFPELASAGPAAAAPTDDPTAEIMASVQAAVTRVSDFAAGAAERFGSWLRTVGETPPTRARRDAGAGAGAGAGTEPAAAAPASVVVDAAAAVPATPPSQKAPLTPASAPPAAASSRAQDHSTVPVLQLAPPPDLVARSRSVPISAEDVARLMAEGRAIVRSAVPEPYDPAMAAVAPLPPILAAPAAASASAAPAAASSPPAADGAGGVDDPAAHVEVGAPVSASPVVSEAELSEAEDDDDVGVVPQQDA